MSRHLVVTGVDGFVGRHLARVAAEAGFDVYGISRSLHPDAAVVSNLAGYAVADLRRGWPRGVPLDADVVHLAGLAAVGPSFDRPQDYIDGNSAMVTSMCEALVEAGFSGRIVGVSTGAVYAQQKEVARAESDPIAFTSPYVVSKILTENQFAYYSRRGLQTVVARPFNHIGPHQGPGFLLSDLLRQQRASSPDRPLRVGNLATRRDYTDVRDVARAYLALATAPVLTHEVYNVASGTARSGREILEALSGALGRPVPPLEVDESLIRSTDPALIVGDSSRLRSDTGWSPIVPFSTTIADTVAAEL